MVKYKSINKNNVYKKNRRSKKIFKNKLSYKLK